MPIGRLVAITSLCALATQSFSEDLMQNLIPKDVPFQANYLVKAKDGLSFEEFRAYQIDVHVQMALALPGLRDYTITFFPPAGDARQPFDAMAQVTFDTKAAHDAALASPNGEAALADLQKFLDMSAMTVVASGTGDVLRGTPTPAQ